jgi:dihydroorotate dehydrogenase electron transfer subunit
MIEVNMGTDPLLKRAFSLFRTTSQELQILYRVRGRGTEILKRMKEGTVLDMLGPLGNSYPVPCERTIPLVVAGGIGIASVYSLVERLAGRAYLFYGSRTRQDLLMLQEVRQLARETFISTDDGSEGARGTAADRLQEFLSRNAHAAAPYVVYACGPHALLEAVAKITFSCRIPSYVAMEERMACGIGACLGCVVNTREGYKRVCKEGPVFRSTEILW